MRIGRNIITNEKGSTVKIEYVKKTFRSKSLAIIDKAEEIMKEYRESGYSLTLRQLYYQFVSRGLIPNNQSEYNRLGSIVGDARLAGLLDWDIMEDRGRNLRIVSTWNQPADILDTCAQQFKIDLWEDQDAHVEVWVEKEALIGVVEPVCRRERVGAFACKGYVSLSEMWSAAHYRFRTQMALGKDVVVIHLGDHDPSGIDMTRDIGERLSLLSGGEIEVVRIALNRDQIDRYTPPPNPAKMTDSRFVEYRRNYGDESWELDALEPKVIENLIQDAIDERKDHAAFAVQSKREDGMRRQLEKIAENIRE